MKEMEHIARILARAEKVRRVAMKLKEEAYWLGVSLDEGQSEDWKAEVGARELHDKIKDLPELVVETTDEILKKTIDALAKYHSA